MDNYDIKSIVSDINFDDNFIGYQNNEVVLTKKEVEILKNLGINYEAYTTMTSIMNVLEEYDDDEEVQEILKDMSDRNYYLNSNK